MDPMDADKQRVLDDIRKYGCHVVHVQAHEALPPFSYTVGIARTSDAADAVVFGLTQDIAHRLLHNYHRRIRGGERFDSGAPFSGFIAGQNCVFRPVDPSHHDAYFNWNVWLQDGWGFKMLQLVYPTVEGIWPWDAMASDWLRGWQPLLSEPVATR